MKISKSYIEIIDNLVESRVSYHYGTSLAQDKKDTNQNQIKCKCFKSKCEYLTCDQSTAHIPK